MITAHPIFKHHLERLKSSTLKKFTMDDLARWISTNTFINGEPYSFDSHEYQLVILEDGSREVVIRKCSQVGIS